MKERASSQTCSWREIKEEIFGGNQPFRLTQNQQSLVDSVHQWKLKENISPNKTTRLNKNNNSSRQEDGKLLLSKASKPHFSAGSSLSTSEIHTERLELRKKSSTNSENPKQASAKDEDGTSSEEVSSRVAEGKTERLAQASCDTYHTPWLQKQKNLSREQNKSAGARTVAANTQHWRHSNEPVWFVNKDTRSAIVSSQEMARKVQSRTKHRANSRANASQKKKTKTKHCSDGVPRFTSIPSKFEELCKNKSVDQLIMANEVSEKDSLEKSQRSFQSRCEKQSFLDKWKSSSADKTKNTYFRDNHNKASNPKKFCKLENFGDPKFVRIYGATERIQVPKNIYIRRENGGNIIEDLVEVRNQNELDLLNTFKALQPANKFGAYSGKCFEDLRDYEVYCYPGTIRKAARSSAVQ